MSKRREQIIDLTEIFRRGCRDPLHQQELIDQYGDEWEGYDTQSDREEDLEELTIHRMPSWLLGREWSFFLAAYQET